MNSPNFFAKHCVRVSGLRIDAPHDSARPGGNLDMHMHCICYAYDYMGMHACIQTDRQTCVHAYAHTNRHTYLCYG